MEFISSDTNVWIDFAVIESIELPFRLPVTYIMSKYAVEEEVLTPKGLSSELLSYGLKPVEITTEEFILANSYGSTYIKLSQYDRIALAIAKNREIELMTGDKALRNAAKNEGVKVIGTLGILDRLYDQGLISSDEYKNCLNGLLLNNGSKVRLPKEEISKRLKLESPAEGKGLRK